MSHLFLGGVYVFFFVQGRGEWGVQVSIIFKCCLYANIGLPNPRTIYIVFLKLQNSNLQ